MCRFYGQTQKGFALIMFFAILGCFPSCISPKKVIYFNDVPDTITLTKPYVINAPAYVDPVIIPNDILSITVQTIAQNETNTPITSSSVAIFNPLNGFLVDKNGNIELSLIGFVKVGGLTTSEARELIKEKAKEYYKDPVVNVRIANYEISVLGDVNEPGTFSFPSEKVNIIEAFAAAKDISITGVRRNVLLIRSSEGTDKKFVRFNMNSSEIFSSPYFYLKQRDVLYVEPSKYKIQESDNRLTRNIGIFSSVISLAALILAFKNYNK